MPTMTLPITRDLEDRLLGDLAETGFTCVENAIDPAFLEQVRGQVDAILDERGHRYFSIIQPQQKEGGAFAEMAATPGFVDLLRNLARRSHSEAAVKDFELYNVLRIIAGDEASKGSFQFHYDATVLTVLMPLYIPEGPQGTTGELIALPNRRGYRSSALINIAEKILHQNPLAFRHYGRRYREGRRNAFRLKPGNLYFFNGYRTFHGNLPCSPGQKRATLLFHFGDPHAGDPMTKAVLKVRRKREERRLHAQ